LFNTSSAVRQGGVLSRILVNATIGEIANKVMEEKISGMKILIFTDDDVMWGKDGKETDYELH
jgi:hypothetical protein